MFEHIAITAGFFFVFFLGEGATSWVSPTRNNAPSVPATSYLPLERECLTVGSLLSHNRWHCLTLLRFLIVLLLCIISSSLRGVRAYSVSLAPRSQAFEGPGAGEGRPGIYALCAHVRNYCVREQWACTQNVITRGMQGILGRA